MSVFVRQPGLLSLLQDRGRFGQHHLGLTTGGPMDLEAFLICQRLLGNTPDCTLIECSFGGLELDAQTETLLCVTGAHVALHINDQPKDLWTTHRVRPGDHIRLGRAERGCRSYVGVAGGFTVAPQFGSTACVLREGIGGLNGSKLAPGDLLPCATQTRRQRLQLAPGARPKYTTQTTVRVVLGYQHGHFPPLQQRRFFSSPWTISQRADRMGYCLEGPAIACDIQGIVSEGICFGAIQVPADGQPIVLLNDRQTIGGYPKLGAALSVDAARMSQLIPGGTVHFAAITSQTAHNVLHLQQWRLQNLPLHPLAEDA
ncbi:MAG: biotin-dependent carboxyltransferase family protein [Haliea sp.]|nr:biotin-dependent carboxyltransferase family protein [Haliea sp.]